MLNAPPERRILIVAEALGYGGTESHLVTVLPRLAEAGLDISVFCLAERGRKGRRIGARRSARARRLAAGQQAR